MRPISALVSSRWLLFVTLSACSASSGPSATRSGTGGTASGGGANAGAPNGGNAQGGSSAAGSPNQMGGATNSAGSAGSSVSLAGASGASAGGTSTSGGMASGGDAPAVACGYMSEGHVLDVTPDIELCIPAQTCLPETCPPTLGSCVNGACVYKAGYDGLQTLPEAWATHYCDLQSGACQGVHQFDPVLTTAQTLASTSSLPLCKSGTAGAECVGIVAIPPMMLGNREKFGQNWGLGLSEPSGLCYEVTGPGGSALLAITDRCGGYCECPSLNVNSFVECGQCAEATDLTPLCECRGANNCSTMQCDWCAANNHPHFDMDDDTFNHVCGDQSIKGSCQLTHVKFVSCLAPRADWPPSL